MREFRLPRGAFALALLLLTLFPLAELALLIAVGRTIGLLPTLLLCAATGFVGAWLARREGLRVALRARQALVEGRFPGDEILDGAAILAGGVLLLTPGFLTDCLGLALLLPPARYVIKRALKGWWLHQQGIIDVRPQ